MAGDIHGVRPAVAGPVVAPTDPALLAPIKHPPVNADRAKFRKAAAEFESFLLYYMLKTMRQAVPKSGLIDSKTSDTYTGLFDQEIAKLAAQRGGFGLAKAIENQLFPYQPPHSSFTPVPPITKTEEEGP